MQAIHAAMRQPAVWPPGYAVLMVCMWWVMRPKTVLDDLRPDKRHRATATLHWSTADADTGCTVCSHLRGAAASQCANLLWFDIV
jgi:hypothetical protein